MTLDLRFLLQVGGQEVVGCPCWLCKDIRLVNMTAPKSRSVSFTMTSQQSVQSGMICYKNAKFEPHRMTPGEAGRLWCYSWRGPVFELNCKEPNFTGYGKPIQSRMWGCVAMCYLPAPYKAVVLTDWNDVKCFSTVACHCMWALHTFVDKKKINPWGVMFIPKYEALLVCDGENSRILIVNPKNGKLVKHFSFPDMGCILDACMYNDQVAIWHKAPGLVNKFSISFFSLR